MEAEIWTQSALSGTRQKTWLPPRCTNELLVGSNGKAKWWGNDPMCRCWESQAFGKCHEVMPWVVLSEADKTLTWVFSLSASLCHIFWGRGPPVYPHPATCLAWHGHRKAAHSFPLFFLPFSPFSFPSPESYWSKRPEQGSISVQGPLTTTSFCMAECISKCFALVPGWHLVPAGGDFAA